MKRKSLTPLGETEMEILHHVWDLREASVADVRDRILQTRDVAYTTVMTVMKKLADKGYLTYRKDGVTYIYTAARRPEDVRSSLIGDLVHKVFHGSPMALVQTLVQSGDLTDEERAALRQLIESMEDGDADAS